LSYGKGRAQPVTRSNLMKDYPTEKTSVAELVALALIGIAAIILVANLVLALLAPETEDPQPEPYTPPLTGTMTLVTIPSDDAEEQVR
jgi:hypothetical protein